MDLAMDLCHSNNMKVVFRKFTNDHSFLTLCTLNYVDCIHFYCMDLFHMTDNQAN